MTQQKDGARQTHPNVVFIMADDMGYGDLGPYGATKIPTPNADRLAREGTCFMDAHSQSAVCTPSRYGVVTGRYCWRTRLKSGVQGGHGLPLIEVERETVASMLRRHGYATAAVGKWHLGLDWAYIEDRPENTMGWAQDGSNVDYSRPFQHGPNQLGFDYFFGIAGSLDMPPYCFLENDRPLVLPTEMKDVYNPQQRKGVMSPGWRDEDVDTTFAGRACDFIRDHVGKRPDDPFFLYLTPSAPHRPCVPPEWIQGASQAGPRGDMVALVDWMTGQVMDTLDELGIAHDTLLVLTSDNGARLADVDGDTHGHRSCGDWRGCKADIWDGGHREPYIVRWPGHVPAGRRCDETVCLNDLMATCAAIVGEDLPAGVAEDSHNVLPAMLGENLDRPIREALVHHSLDGMFAIRQGDWKCIRGLGSGGFSDPKRVDPEPGGPEGQLYNMKDDPRETRNLWQDRPAVVEHLSEILRRYQDQGCSAPHAVERRS